MSAANSSSAADDEFGIPKNVRPGRQKKGGAPSSVWRLVSADLAARLGAYCLDGSLPGYWYQRPPLAASAGSSTSWLVFIDGGAWCYDEHSCESRARGFKGSTANAGSGFWPYSGYMDASPSTNPTFATFHRAHLHYCDGASFSGDRSAPYVPPGEGKKPLYFRGRRVLQALLQSVAEAGMRDATEVLFSGGSAGGIAAMHSASVARSLVPHARRFKVLLLSGFFLERPLPRQQQQQQLASATSDAAEDAPTCRRGRGAADTCVPWAQKMRRMCEVHNCTPTMAQSGCGPTLPPAQQWRCLFGRHAAGAMGAPTFVINSALDSWQMVNVWRRYAKCRWDGDKSCTPAQVASDVADTNQMLKSFVRDLRASGVLDRPGNGAFITSCNEHVAGLSPAPFTKYAVGDRTMRDALADWWAADEAAPTAQHTYLPCELGGHNRSATARFGGKALAHHGCNPTCDVYRARRRLSQECPCSP